MVVVRVEAEMVRGILTDGLLNVECLNKDAICFRSTTSTLQPTYHSSYVCRWKDMEDMPQRERVSSSFIASKQ